MGLLYTRALNRFFVVKKKRWVSFAQFWTTTIQSTSHITVIMISTIVRMVTIGTQYTSLLLYIFIYFLTHFISISSTRFFLISCFSIHTISITLFYSTPIVVQYPHIITIQNLMNLDCLACCRCCAYFVFLEFC